MLLQSLQDPRASSLPPLPPGLTAFLFVSDDGAAWREFDAALRAGLTAAVPPPAALRWLPVAAAPFASGVLYPGALFDGAWAAAAPDASWASHAVVYVTALAGAPDTVNATVEGLARAAVAGAVASRVTSEPPDCALAAAHAGAGVEQERVVIERLAALSPFPTAPLPSASKFGARPRQNKRTLN